MAAAAAVTFANLILCRFSAADSLHHAAFFDAFMAARLATSLPYVLERLFPSGGGLTAATPIRQFVGKARWWRHVRAEWVQAEADQVDWARWKATY